VVGVSLGVTVGSVVGERVGDLDARMVRDRNRT